LILDGLDGARGNSKDPCENPERFISIMGRLAHPVIMTMVTVAVQLQFTVTGYGFGFSILSIRQLHSGMLLNRHVFQF
jgi:hypothetical protein